MSRSGAAYALVGQTFGGFDWAVGTRFQSPAALNRSTTVAPGDGVVRGYPFYMPAPGLSAQAIGTEITTPGTAGALVRLGIYRWNGPRVDPTLVLDAGTIDGTAVAGVYEIVIAQVLPTAPLVLVAVNQGTPATPTTLRAASSAVQFTGSNTAPGLPSLGVSLSTTVAGALPASVPVTSVGGSVTAPIVHLRAA